MHNEVFCVNFVDDSAMVKNANLSCSGKINSSERKSSGSETIFTLLDWYSVAFQFETNIKRF